MYFQDMEDLDQIKCLKTCEKKCEIDEDWCVIEKENMALLHVAMKANRWYKAYAINDIFQVGIYLSEFLLKELNGYRFL